MSYLLRMLHLLQEPEPRWFRGGVGGLEQTGRHKLEPPQAVVRGFLRVCFACVNFLFWKGKWEQLGKFRGEAQEGRAMEKVGNAEGGCWRGETWVLVSDLLLTSCVMLGEFFYLTEFLFTHQ